MARKTKKDLEAEIDRMRLELRKNEACLAAAMTEIRNLKRQRTSMHEIANHTAGVKVGWEEAHEQLADLLADLEPPRRDMATVPMHHGIVEGPRGMKKVLLPAKGIPND